MLYSVLVERVLARWRASSNKHIWNVYIGVLPEYCCRLVIFQCDLYGLRVEVVLWACPAMENSVKYCMFENGLTMRKYFGVRDVLDISSILMSLSIHQSIPVKWAILWCSGTIITQVTLLANAIYSPAYTVLAMSIHWRIDNIDKWSRSPNSVLHGWNVVYWTTGRVVNRMVNMWRYVTYSLFRAMFLSGAIWQSELSSRHYQIHALSTRGFDHV